MTNKDTKPKDAPPVVVKPEPSVEPDRPAARGKAPDQAALVTRRDVAQRAHAAAVQAQTMAEIEADTAMRDFSTRFTEHMTTAPRTMAEIDAAYALAQTALDITEDKAAARTEAQSAVRQALADYLDAYHAVLVNERRAADAELP